MKKILVILVFSVFLFSTSAFAHNEKSRYEHHRVSDRTVTVFDTWTGKMHNVTSTKGDSENWYTTVDPINKSTS